MRMCSLFPTCVGLTLARNDLKLRFPSVETSLIKTSDNLPTVNLEAKIKIVSKIPCAFGRCTYVSKIQGWSITKWGQSVKTSPPNAVKTRIKASSMTSPPRLLITTVEGCVSGFKVTVACSILTGTKEKFWSRWSLSVAGKWSRRYLHISLIQSLGGWLWFWSSGCHRTVLPWLQS